jgi:hypothetical protein
MLNEVGAVAGLAFRHYIPAYRIQSIIEADRMETRYPDFAIRPIDLASANRKGLSADRITAVKAQSLRKRQMLLVVKVPTHSVSETGPSPTTGGTTSS